MAAAAHRQEGTRRSPGVVNVTAKRAKATTAAARRLALEIQAQCRPWTQSGYSGACPVRDVPDRIGDTWSVLLVLTLGGEPKRFRELLRAVQGISQRMLTVTLRALERDGLVARTVHGTRPPSVAYSLTPLGQSLLPPIKAVADWSIAHAAQVQQARAQYESRAVAAQPAGVIRHRLV